MLRWRAIWPLFVRPPIVDGLALVTFVVFLKHRRIAFGFALVPALLMAVMPLMALCMMVDMPFSMLGACPGNSAARPVCLDDVAALSSD